MIDDKRAEEARQHLFSGKAFYEEEKGQEEGESTEMDPMYRNDGEEAEKKRERVLEAIFSGKPFRSDEVL